MHHQIDGIMLPHGHSETADLISTYYPSIKVQEYEDRTFIPTNNDLLEVPLNSIIMESDVGELVANKIVYPWDLLRTMAEVMETEIKRSAISENASISKTSVITGPCIIEDGVYIDDFCKVKGPVYIGQNTKVGTGSLVRNSFIGMDSVIGFNCEIARSYLAGRNSIAHHNVILDSVLGEDSWLGGYVGTTNVRLDRKNVRYKVDNQFIDTGLQNFGAVIGSHCSIGAHAVILPGRNIPSNSTVQAGAVVSSEVECSQCCCD
jgi:NDP-sugar pyrophosphorylase family protein